MRQPFAVLISGSQPSVSNPKLRDENFLSLSLLKSICFNQGTPNRQKLFEQRFQIPQM